MTTQSIASGAGFRRVQVANLRREHGYPDVCVDVLLNDEHGVARSGSSNYSIALDSAGGLHPSIMTWAGDLSSDGIAAIRQAVRGFISKHEHAIRALNPPFSRLG